MRARDGPRKGLQGVGPPVPLGSNDLAITKLLYKYTDVFASLVSLPSDCIIYIKNLIDTSYDWMHSKKGR